MTKDKVRIGGIYLAKVSGRSVEVRIDREHPRNGWDATSLATNKKIRVKSAQRLTESKARREEPTTDEDTMVPAEALVAPDGGDTEPATEVEAPTEVEPAPVDAEPAAPAPTEPAPAAADRDLVPLTQLDKAKKTKPAKAKTPKEPKAKPAAADKPAKGMGCLDAAAEVLKTAGTPMRCRGMIAAMKEQGLWTSTAATPEATLYSAILREITTKGSASRFKKTERGHFSLSE